MVVRAAALTDLDRVTALCVRLWPDVELDDQRDHVARTLAGRPPSTQPLAYFVAEDAGRLIGFVEVGRRSHAEDCDPRRPCGFIEGWYVDPAYRRRGVGRRLIDRAEQWAREHGCIDLASDTWADNEISVRAHVALGFAVGERLITLHKAIRPAEPALNADHYGAELARIHHASFGFTARNAATELIPRIPVRSGTVVDLAAGSGILSRCLADAGYDVYGIDISEAMLSIARTEVPTARFVHQSLWQAELPSCVAVAAVGEAFSYAADPAASLGALERRLSTIYDALIPGGVLVFDVAGPGRSGPTGTRRTYWSHAGTSMGIIETEDHDARRLTRSLEMFIPDGDRYRRSVEIHMLQLHSPDEIEAVLGKLGFSYARLDRYGEFSVSPGWHAYVATK
ncbi:MAG: GNAT family N-acetyltransferase [Kofleriaceae bacterium]